MNLAEKRFAEVFAAQNWAPKGSANRDNKRRAPRHKHSANVTVIPCYKCESETIPVKLIDFSSRGVRFEHTEAIEHGSEFVIMLPRTNASAVPMLCWVVHSRKEAGQLWSIGAEFVCITDPSGPVKRSPESTNASAKRIAALMMK